MKNSMIAVLLAFLVVLPIFYLAINRNNISDNQLSDEFSNINTSVEQRILSDLMPDEELNVVACKVLDGHRFNLLLEDERSVNVQLVVVAKSEAKSFVEGLLKKTESAPHVYLLKKVDDYWIVRFEVEQNGKFYDLVDVLKSKDLTFYR